jgi:hypothetical protein
VEANSGGKGQCMIKCLDLAALPADLASSFLIYLSRPGRAGGPSFGYDALRLKAGQDARANATVPLKPLP